jgi:hypothetical protein
MSLPDYNAALDAVKESLDAFMPQRYVQRNLTVAADESRERLTAGVVCLVGQKGGNFANYRGREAQQGTIDVALVGFLQVAESTKPDAIERAELVLLGEMLAWVAGGVTGADRVTAGDWRQSRQLEHPYGWVVLELTVKP